MRPTLVDDKGEDEDEGEDTIESVEQNEPGTDVMSGSSGSKNRLVGESTSSEESRVDEERQTTDSLPYIYRWDCVQDCQSGATFHLWGRVHEEENEFVEELEEFPGEDVTFTCLVFD